MLFCLLVVSVILFTGNALPTRNERIVQALKPQSQPSTECLNGGISLNKGTPEATCQCPELFTGSQCETPVCLNDGYLSESGCFCVCRYGFIGKHCQKKQTPNSGPTECKNGGSLVNAGIPNMRCKCAPFFVGNECETKECLNGGSLGENDNCICPTGFTGANCEKKQPPKPDPEISYCLNGGRLLNAGTPYATCECGQLFSGSQCETKVCLNDGHLDLYGNCICLAGFMGEYCEREEPQNPVVSHCQNGGKLLNAGTTSATCECGQLFTGSECETPVCLNGYLSESGRFCVCFYKFFGMHCDKQREPHNSPY